MSLARDGQRVCARGVFAKGLKDGSVYTLRDGGEHYGHAVYDFMTSRGRVAARFYEDQVDRFMLEGRRATDKNGLVSVTNPTQVSA